MKFLAKCMTCNTIIKNIEITHDQAALLGKGNQINLIHPAFNSPGDVSIKPPVAVDIANTRLLRLSVTPECVYFEGCAGGMDCQKIPDRFIANTIKEGA